MSYVLDSRVLFLCFMLEAIIVNSKKELEQIHILNQQNLRQNVSRDEQLLEGFVSWHYSLELLEKMHALAQSIIVKDGDDVVAYALVTLKEACSFHTDLQMMLANLESVEYKGRSLMLYDFYLMGQICISKNYRGKGVFNLLYQHHKKIYSKEYELLVTEISVGNTRSLKAHEKLGFQTIHTYSDNKDIWNIVVWDWTNTDSPR